MRGRGEEKFIPTPPQPNPVYPTFFTYPQNKRSSRVIKIKFHTKAFLQDTQIQHSLNPGLIRVDPARSVALQTRTQTCYDNSISILTHP